MCKFFTQREFKWTQNWQLIAADPERQVSRDPGCSDPGEGAHPGRDGRGGGPARPDDGGRPRQRHPHRRGDWRTPQGAEAPGSHQDHGADRRQRAGTRAGVLYIYVGIVFITTGLENKHFICQAWTYMSCYLKIWENLLEKIMFSWQQLNGKLKIKSAQLLLRLKRIFFTDSFWCVHVIIRIFGSGKWQIRPGKYQNGKFVLLQPLLELSLFFELTKLNHYLVSADYNLQDGFCPALVSSCENNVRMREEY